ncbi:MAG: sulfite exporter TauE/SafE family protein [Spirochaetota bacterium]
MGIVSAILYVDGMTCPACESRISKSLLAIGGVKEAWAQARGGKVDVEFDEALVDLGTLKATIEKVGYAIRVKRNSSTAVAIGLGVLLAALYLLASSSGLFNALPKVDASIGYAMLFVVGLLTSIHCVAMCGGIALSQSIRRQDEGTAAEPPSGKRQQLTPGLLYNTGRILSYTVIGGVVGALGAAFNFSPVIRGTIASLAGLLMVVLGLRMLGLLKVAPHLARFVPVRLRLAGTKAVLALRSHGPFTVGVLNGFMPCGPLQTMQLYALGTGSALAGAASMFIFSVGTVPLMLVFGLTAALLPRKFVPVMVKASAVLVMFLGVVTFGRAAALSGIPLPDFSSSSSSYSNSSSPSLAFGGTTQSASIIPVGGTASSRDRLFATIENGIQTITTEFKDGYYVPFTVQAGVPLRWTIRIKEDDINGCNNPVEVPGYRIRKTLVPGDNIIEFTPAKEGTIPYSCWMGMIRSRITVVENIATTGPGTGEEGGSLSELFGTDSVGGGACCSGTSNPEFAGGRVPADTIGMPVVKGGIQEITITVGNDGYSPNSMAPSTWPRARWRPQPSRLRTISLSSAGWDDPWLCKSRRRSVEGGHREGAD